MQKLTSIALPSELKARLEERAKKEGLYVSVIIRRGIELYLKTPYYQFTPGVPNAELKIE